MSVLRHHKLLINMFFLRKNTFIILCFAVIYTTANAQINRNTWTVGGSFNLGVDMGTTAGALNHFLIQPKVGYFPIKHLHAGAIVLVDYQKIGFREATLQTGYGPFLRYYIKTPKKISPYINTEVIFTSFQEFFYNGDGSSNSFVSPRETLIRPGIGLAIFLTPHIALENQINFEYATTDKIRYGEWSVLQFSVGFQIHFYHIGKS